MNKYALIVAGGKGNRMKTDIPKQFLKLANKPLLMRTLEAFYLYDKQISVILVLPEEQIDFWKSLCKEFKFTIPHKMTSGGIERFDSVKNGLKLIYDEGIVAIHDGVRPLVSKETIKRCFTGAEKNGNAIPAIAAIDSIRLIKEDNSIPLDRSKIVFIQTPQTFKVHLIKKAFDQNLNNQFTDDANVLESMGEKIFLVDGNRENIKITNPVDLMIAEALYNNFV